jgi:hypothetical protein
VAAVSARETVAYLRMTNREGRTMIITTGRLAELLNEAYDCGVDAGHEATVKAAGGEVLEPAPLGVHTFLVAQGVPEGVEWE